MKTKLLSKLKQKNRDGGHVREAQNNLHNQTTNLGLLLVLLDDREEEQARMLLAKMTQPIY